MPYKFETDHIKLPRANDRRVKLTDDDKDTIKELRLSGMSYVKIAAAVGCSKRMVMFIVNPHMEAKCKEQYKERRKDGRYYKKEKHTPAIKRHRKHKKRVLTNNR